MIAWHPAIDFSTFEQRLASFRLVTPLARQAAHAGYFYSCQYKELTCFLCYASLKHAEETDILMAEHAISSSDCPFVKLRCSRDFLEQLSKYKSRYLHFNHDSSFVINRLKKSELAPFGLSERAAAQQCQLLKIPYSQIPEVQKEIQSLVDYPQEEVAQKKGYECVICLTLQRRILFFPCRHLLVCPECAFALKDCPFCRESIEYVLRVSY